MFKFIQFMIWHFIVSVYFANIVFSNYRQNNQVFRVICSFEKVENSQLELINYFLLYYSQHIKYQCKDNNRYDHLDIYLRCRTLDIK